MQGRFPGPALAALLLTGCANGEGIWFILAETVVFDPAEVCTGSVTHNFTDAYEPEEGTVEQDWTIEDTLEQSQSGRFAQITFGPKKQAWLVIDDMVYPGEKTDGKVYTFAWAGTEDTFHSESHVDGYFFSESVNGSSTETIEVTFDGPTLSGSSKMTSKTVREYQEDDEYQGQKIGIPQGGQIPVGQYLVVDQDFGGKPQPVPASNSGAEADCDSDRCQLTVTSECTWSVGVTGELTGYEEEAVYEGLEDASRPGGISP